MKITAWLLLLVRVLADVTAILLAFLAGFYIHFLTPPSAATALQFLAAYYKILFLVVLLWLVVFNLVGLYRYNLEPLAGLTGPDKPWRIISGVTLASLVTYGVTYLFPEYFLIRQPPRPLIIFTWLFGLILIGLFRFCIGRCSRMWDKQAKK